MCIFLGLLLNKEVVFPFGVLRMLTNTVTEHRVEKDTILTRIAAAKTVIEHQIFQVFPLAKNVHTNY